MSLEELFRVTRRALPPATWTHAVKLARAGAVVGVGQDDDEIRLHVKTKSRARPFAVEVWPGDTDAGCDCPAGEQCVHIAASLIALRRSLVQDGKPLPRASSEYQVRLRYAFSSDGARLKVQRYALHASGKVEAIQRPLAELNYLATRSDMQAETLLFRVRGDSLDADPARTLLRILAGAQEVTLDGEPVVLSDEPLLFRVRVTNDAQAFKVGLYRPRGVEKMWRGAALIDGTLRPTSHGDLTPNQRKFLIKGTWYQESEVARLMTDLRNLRERIPVDIDTDRLPDERALEPRIEIHLSEVPAGLEVRPEIVYGKPPVARVKGGQLQVLGGVVPARDQAKERQVAHTFQARFGFIPGHGHLLKPEAAAGFLENTIERFNGDVVGSVNAQRFRVHQAELAPVLNVAQATTGDWRLDVSFGDDDFAADPMDVVRAWRGNRSLVPLLGGGYAPLPEDWMAKHGALLQELLDARDDAGRVGRNSTAALVELLEGARGDVPPDLRKLRAFLEGDDGLPDAELPDTLNAELRPYQQVGFRWLRFLREMELCGVLADDMGLGKTVQALTAILDAGGKTLVVAPTSVLRNWQREAGRFAPSLSVNLYHGPTRKLDDSDITLTSYAIMRLDLDRLRETEWNYLILDEAQYIKNPGSQTARSAYRLRAKHRLALTGTPVENRLEELWSLFHFLMPGLLGLQSTFRERFARPVEAGDDNAKTMLRKRVRPYILRRMKSQVAEDLPPLTEVVERCEMSPEQRKVYEAVRLTARQEVMANFQQDGAPRGLTIQVLESLLRMRQACCDPSLLPGSVGDGAGSAKLDRLEEMLVELVSSGHKALVFSQWTSMLDRCEPRLDALGIDYVRLDGGTRDRQAAIDAFQNPDGPPVFLLSLKAGGTGLNLTEADYVVHLDPWWNPAVEQQATDRAHRIGQSRPVVSCRLIAAGTVEERILELQAAKRALADVALGTDGGFLRSLSASELRSLFDV